MQKQDYVLLFSVFFDEIGNGRYSVYGSFCDF